MSTYKTKNDLNKEIDNLTRELEAAKSCNKTLKAQVERRRVCLTNAVNSKYKLKRELDVLKGYHQIVVDLSDKRLDMLTEACGEVRDLRDLKEETKNLLHSTDKDMKMLHKSYLQLMDSEKALIQENKKLKEQVALLDKGSKQCWELNNKLGQDYNKINDELKSMQNAFVKTIDKEKALAKENEKLAASVKLYGIDTKRNWEINNKLGYDNSELKKQLDTLKKDKKGLVKEVFDRGKEISYHKEIITIRENTINSYRKELEKQIDINDKIKDKIDRITKQVFLIDTYSKRIEELKEDIKK